MDSDGSEFYYSKEMTNGNQKKKYIYIYIYIGAIANEEKQQNVDVLKMANVQNYILAQQVENS